MESESVFPFFEVLAKEFASLIASRLSPFDLQTEVG